MTLDRLNTLDAGAAEAEFRRCCGSTRWAAQMAAARPFPDAAAMADTADAIWASLDPQDWLEAFAAHPRIGERKGAAWSYEEQKGVTDDSRAQFEQLNRDYEARFGYIFIVSATGKSAAEMLSTLRRRLGHQQDVELREAAEAQRQITRLRLAKLLT